MAQSQKQRSYAPPVKSAAKGSSAVVENELLETEDPETDPPVVPEAPPVEHAVPQPASAPTAFVTSIKRQPTTHFTGPIESGYPNIGTSGHTLLVKRWDLDFSLGPVPAMLAVNLPPNTILLDLTTVVFTALDNAMNITLGSTPGGGDLLATDALLAPENVVNPILPIANPSPSVVYLSFAATPAPTTGRATLLLRYSRI